MVENGDKIAGIARKRLASRMDEELGEVTSREEDIVLLSCEKCEDCTNFEDLLTELEIGRIVNVESDEGKAYIAMCKIEPEDREYLSKRGFHPLLIANTEPQVQFTKTPPDEDKLREWYRLFYLEDLETEEE